MSKRQAIGYVRIASEKQTPDSDCIAAQKTLINEAAQHLDVEIVKWFEQVGAERTHQRALDKALEYCENNLEVDYLLVADTSRISRSLEYFYYWQVAFDRIGIEIKTSNYLEDETPMRRFMDTIDMAMAKLNSENRSVRIKEGLRRKKEREE